MRKKVGKRDMKHFLHFGKSSALVVLFYNSEDKNSHYPAQIAYCVFSVKWMKSSKGLNDDKYCLMKCFRQEHLVWMALAAATIAEAKHLCPLSLTLIVSLYQRLGEKQESRLVSIQVWSNPFSCLSNNVLLQPVKQLCTTAVFTDQMNRCWTSNCPLKR